jgi:hypothetical protein
MLKKQKNSAGGSTKRKLWVDPDDAPEITDELLDRVWDSVVFCHGDRIIHRGPPPPNVDFLGVRKPRESRGNARIKPRQA